jgi:hypothetical protein
MEFYWLREIGLKKNIMGAVLLDFSATFDIIEHSHFPACWENVCVMALHPLLYCG